MTFGRGPDDLHIAFLYIFLKENEGSDRGDGRGRTNGSKTRSRQKPRPEAPTTHLHKKGMWRTQGGQPRHVFPLKKPPFREGSDFDTKHVKEK